MTGALSMPINLEFDSLEGLPDPLKAVLVERDGKYVLEGETPDEVKGLKAAHEREKAQAKKLADDLKKQAELYKDLDPEKAREALKQIEQLEEQTLMDAGTMDELFENRLTAARDAWEREKQALVREASRCAGVWRRCRQLSCVCRRSMCCSCWCAHESSPHSGVLTGIRARRPALRGRRGWSLGT
jgi:hypothetical protein